MTEENGRFYIDKDGEKPFQKMQKCLGPPFSHRTFSAGGTSGTGFQHVY